MITFTPDLIGLLNVAFGYVPIGLENGYKAPEKASVARINDFQVNVPLQQISTSRASQYGHPLLFPFTFKGKTYKKFNNQGELVEYPLPDFDLPAATLVDFSRAKNIVKTQVTGGDGEVKELISFADWKIRIRGICLNDQAHSQAKTGQRQKEILLQWENVAGHVEIMGGDLFTEKGISAIVIEEFATSQVEGAPDFIPFEMQCSSDIHPDIFLL